MGSSKLIVWLSLGSYALFVTYSYGEMAIGWQHIKAWIYAHEELTAGILAVASAAFGGWLLYRQTLQTAELEEGRRRSRHEAIRTMLPLALSEIIRYSVECANAAKHLLDQCQGEALPHGATIPSVPEIPMTSLRALSELCEYSTVEQIALVSQIPRVIQYQSSRLKGTVDDLINPPSHVHVTTRSSIEGHVLDAAEVYARTEALFEYARREVDEMPGGTTWRRMNSALFLMRFWDHEYRRLNESIERRSRGDLDTFMGDR